MDEQQPLQEGELGDRVGARTACIPSLPDTPMPMCASWIIDTSLAPSPIASVIGCGTMFAFTSRTMSAFCIGETRQATTAVQSATIDRKRRRSALSSSQ